MTALSNRVHLSAHPNVKDQLVGFFTQILDCEVVSSAAAERLPMPVVAFRFPDGGGFSVEFREDALSESQARRGVYLEVQSADPAALKAKVLAAGLSEVPDVSTTYFYFAAPGGQVWRIVPMR